MLIIPLVLSCVRCHFILCPFSELDRTLNALYGKCTQSRRIRIIRSFARRRYFQSKLHPIAENLEYNPLRIAVRHRAKYLGSVSLPAQQPSPLDASSRDLVPQSCTRYTDALSDDEGTIASKVSVPLQLTFDFQKLSTVTAMPSTTYNERGDCTLQLFWPYWQ